MLNGWKGLVKQHRLIAYMLFVCVPLGSAQAAQFSATGFLTEIYNTCSSPMDGVFPGFTVTIQGTAILISHPNIAFGRQDTLGEPLVGVIRDGAVSAELFETPDVSDLDCPTCTWTMNFTGLIDPGRRAIMGTIAKTPAGGECLSTSEFELIVD